MTCEETHILLQALIDGELDAGHAREVEAHVADCPRCAAQLRDYRGMHAAMSAPGLRYQAPASLRARLERALPTTALPAPRASATTRRSLMQGFGMGSMASPPLAPSLVPIRVHTNTAPPSAH